MASRRTGGTRPEMIHCEFCGEDYAASYKHCPFCDEVDADGELDDTRVRGGKRLVSNTRGGGYGGGPSVVQIILTVLSLALIVAAVIIVISIIKPLIDRGQTKLPVESPTTSVQPADSPDPGASPGPDASPAPDASPGPDASPAPDATPGPDATPTPTVPAGQTATGFTLDKTEFTLSDRWPDPITLKVTFIPAGSTGSITWTSSDPDVVTVDANGKVSHGSKKGSATITATLAGGVTQTCKVYNSVTAAGGSSTGGNGGTGEITGGSAGAALSLNRTDFTLEPGQSFKVKVSGTSAAPSWSIGNASVATVGSDGTVTHVGKGDTTLTCTVDGQTLTCIVRCR